MNALVTIDRILSPETIATPGDIITPAIVFAPGGVEAIVSKLESDVRATVTDMSTDAGREAIKSLAYKVARSKTALDDMGKNLVAEIKKQSGAIDAERRIIRERLDALRDEVRAPLIEWEARVDDHEDALVAIVKSPRDFPNYPSVTVEEIRSRIAALRTVATRDWEEFHERAEAAVSDALAELEMALAAAIRREADAAELAELRQLKADREAADLAAANAAAAADTARLQAENAAREAAQRAEQENAREIARADQAARDARAAAGRAVEDERRRVAVAAASEKAAADKREANKKHRAKISADITAALLSEGLSTDTADQVLNALAAGRITHVSITY